VEEPLLKKNPEIIERIHELMEYETVGDPMRGTKWTRKTIETIAGELGKLNIALSICENYAKSNGFEKIIIPFNCLNPDMTSLFFMASFRLQ